jgi:hypothetical protein
MACRKRAGDDRMHLRLGQAAWHNAQNKTSRHLSHCSRFHAQPDRLQPDPRSELVPARPAKLPRTIDRITRATPTREKPMLFPANFNFKAAVIDVAKLVDRPWCAPSGIYRRCSLRCRIGFFQQTARQTDGLPTRHKRDRACACDRTQGSGLHSCHGGGWSALLAFSSSHQRSHSADAHGNNQRAYKQ